MKAKKILSLVLAIALVFTASMMMVEVFAMVLYDYQTAMNGDGTVQGAGTVQANVYYVDGSNYSEYECFSHGYATVRVDRVNYTASGEYKLQVWLDTYSCGVQEPTYFVDPKIVSLTDDVRHLNFDSFGPYGVGFVREQQIDRLVGRYAIQKVGSDETIDIPVITLSVE